MYALVTLAFSVYGQATIQFATVPKLYTTEECEIEAPKFVNRLNNPRVGEKETSNARANCVPLTQGEAEKLVRALEQDRKNENYLYANHYRTEAFRIDGEHTFIIVPSLNLTSQDVWIRNGESTARKMVGIKMSRGPIAEVLFNCVRMSIAEANAIIATFRGSQGWPPSMRP